MVLFVWKNKLRVNVQLPVSLSDVYFAPSQIKDFASLVQTLQFLIRTRLLGKTQNLITTWFSDWISHAGPPFASPFLFGCSVPGLDWERAAGHIFSSRLCLLSGEQSITPRKALAPVVRLRPSKTGSGGRPCSNGTSSRLCSTCAVAMDMYAYVPNHISTKVCIQACILHLTSVRKLTASV
jgi:hypothetical protein